MALFGAVRLILAILYLDLFNCPILLVAHLRFIATASTSGCVSLTLSRSRTLSDPSLLRSQFVCAASVCPFPSCHLSYFYTLGAIHVLLLSNSVVAQSLVVSVHLSFATAAVRSSNCGPVSLLILSQ